MIVTNTVKNAVFSLWAKKINPKFLNEFVNTFHLFTSSFVNKIIKILGTLIKIADLIYNL